MFLLPKKTGFSGRSLTLRLIIRIIENVFLTSVGYMETDFKEKDNIMFHNKLSSFIGIL